MNQEYMFFGAAGNLGWVIMRRLINAAQKQAIRYHQ